MNMLRFSTESHITEYAPVPHGDGKLLNQMIIDGFRFNEAIDHEPIPDFHRGDWIFLEIDCDDAEIHDVWWTRDEVDLKYSMGSDNTPIWPVYLEGRDGRWYISYYYHDGVNYIYRPDFFSSILAIPRNPKQTQCHEALIRPDTHICEGDTPFRCAECEKVYCAGCGAADEDFDLCDNCVMANE